MKLELQAEVQSLELETLQEIMDRSLMLEERNREWKGSGVSPVENGLGHGKSPISLQNGPTRSRGWTSREVGGLKHGEGSSGEKGGGLRKKLSQVELQERSRKGCVSNVEKGGAMTTFAR